MAIVDRTSARIVATTVALALMLCACDQAPVSSGSPEPASPSPAAAAPTFEPAPTRAPRSGGTITMLTQAEQLNHIDPQRVYTLEDSAFLGATIYRSLLSYVASPDPVTGTTLAPDLATDLGRPADGGRTWAFTLREHVSFETGDPITCEDIRYGVSRAFANNVISEGPTYAIQYLDIPAATDADTEQGYLSGYHGPYASTPQQQALFEKAVGCSDDHRTITFHLNRPIADFNYTTTLGFVPVPKEADTGETYGTYADQLPVSSGPYRVESYTTGTGGRLVLARNLAWDPSSDPIRMAYPDRWVIEFGIDPESIDRRLLEDAGEDEFAIQHGYVQDETANTVFPLGGPINPDFAARAIAGDDPYARYLWINVPKVPNLKVRQAMLVALDREAVRQLRGELGGGSFLDGVIKPSMGMDYAPTGIWDTFFGSVVPPTGDPDLAKRLLRESGEPAPTLQYQMYDTPINQATLKSIQASLGEAGFTVEPLYSCTGYCSIVFDPSKAADFGTGGWGADWPNASTVIPQLFTQKGGWDLSQVDDSAFNLAVDDALMTLDRAEQARKWQELNRQAIENAWVIPTIAGPDLRLAGSRVGPIYQWPAFHSWPYPEMYVTG